MNASREPTSILGAFSDLDREVTLLVERAMTDVREAQMRWARTALVQRLKLVRELRLLIVEEALQLAEGSSSARQRPTVEALASEVLPLAEACRFLEQNAATILSSRRVGRRSWPLWLARVHSEIHRQPLGVILIVGPGNYPLLLPGVQLIQALVAGNAALVKPGVGGAPAAKILCDLIIRAGFDSKLVALLPDSSEAACAAIQAQPDKVVFTGSAATGEKILAQLAPLLIPATMELSGCDAVIVRADADLDLVTRALAFGLTLNNGATCMSPKRVFVSAACAAELEGRLAQSLGALSVRGPLVTERLGQALDEAFALGARAIAGSVSPEGNMASPFVLAGVSPSSQLLRRDFFAPWVGLVTVVDDNEAVLRVNDCPFALTVSVFSGDEGAARSLAARINAGVVTINDLIIPTADAHLPFGGRRRSGFGVTRGAEGLLELTAPKVVAVSRGKFRPAFDPPQPGDEDLFIAYLALSHGRTLKRRLAALVSLMGRLLPRLKSSPEENA